MANLILIWRLPLLIAAPTVMVILLWVAPPPRFDNSVESMLDADDPAIELLHRFRATFGSEEDIFVGIDADDVLSPKVLAAITAIGDQVSDLDNVRHVISIATAMELRGDQGDLQVVPLMPTIPTTAEGQAALRQRVLSKEVYRNQLLSADGTAAGMVVRVYEPERSGDGKDYRAPLTDACRKIVDRACASPTIRACHVIGAPVLKTDLVRMSREDYDGLMWIAVVLIVGVLAVFFRSFKPVVLTAVSVVIALQITLAIVLMSGRLLNMVTVMIAPLVLVIGLTTTVHLLSRYAEELRAGQPPRKALKLAIHHVGMASLLTSLTTAAGFGSLITSPVVAVREFGIFSAIGILVALLVAMTLVPAALSFLPGLSLSPALGQGRSLTGRAVQLAATIVTHKRRQLWVVALLLAVAASIGVMRVEVETNTMQFFPRHHPARLAYMFINDRLSGISPLEIVFEAEQEGGLKEPSVLRALDAYRAWMAARPETGKVLGLPDLIKELNQAIHGGAATQRRIPDSRQAVTQYLLLYELSGDARGVDVYEYVTDDFTMGRLSARLHLNNSAGFVRLVRDLEAFRDAHPVPGVRVHLTGTVVLYSDLSEKLLLSLFQSFGLALLVIFGLMTLMFRSLRLGAISMIPNLIPVSLAAGVMGWADFSLTVATAMIASVAIGIAVDDTIHFLVRFRSEMKQNPDELSACCKVVTTTGRPVIFTSLIISAGFSILVFSNFRPNMEFGILTAVAMITAMVADLTITPAALIWFRQRGAPQQVPPRVVCSR